MCRALLDAVQGVTSLTCWQQLHVRPFSVLKKSVNRETRKVLFLEEKWIKKAYYLISLSETSAHLEKPPRNCVATHSWVLMTICIVWRRGGWASAKSLSAFFTILSLGGCKRASSSMHQQYEQFIFSHLHCNLSRPVSCCATHTVSMHFDWQMKYHAT